MNRNQLLIISLFTGVMGASAQNNSVSAGGVATGTGGSATYSIGQTSYKTATGTGGSATEGNQQPIEIFPTGISNPDVKISALAWPNPTTSGITLTMDAVSPGQSSYSLYDEQGKLIEQHNISSVNTEINMAALSNGVYILRVIYKNENSVKTFKIVKNS